MTDGARERISDADRQVMRTDILKFIQNEIQDRQIVLALDLPIDRVVIDSIDLARVLFRIEEKWGGEIVLSHALAPETVGDLVDALIDSLQASRP